MDREYVDKCTIYSTVTGSTAYGTNTPESDLNVRGIAVADNLNYYFGYLDRFDQFFSITERTKPQIFKQVIC